MNLIVNLLQDCLKIVAIAPLLIGASELDHTVDPPEVFPECVDEVVAVDAVSDLLSFVPEDAVREAGSNASGKFLSQSAH